VAPAAPQQGLAEWDRVLHSAPLVAFWETPLPFPIAYGYAIQGFA